MRQLGEAEDGCVGKPLLNMVRQGTMLVECSVASLAVHHVDRADAAQGPYMKMYSTYCNNQTEAMSLMAKLMEENEEFYEHCQVRAPSVLDVLRVSLLRSPLALTTRRLMSPLCILKELCNLYAVRFI